MECIDYFLTQSNELVSTYLPLTGDAEACSLELKVHYVNKQELVLERKRGRRDVPKLRDFEFIKVLGTGGFATVYMGK